jgi:hypothetical protein
MRADGSCWDIAIDVFNNIRATTKVDSNLISYSNTYIWAYCALSLTDILIYWTFSFSTRFDLGFIFGD